MLYVAAIFPPSISAPDIFYGIVGSESNYTISITSATGFATFAFNGMTGSNSFPSNMRILQVNFNSLALFWTPLHRDETFVLDVISYAVIGNAAAFSLFRPQVQLCDCQNGEKCTNNGVLQYDDDFILLQCICLPGRM